MLWAEVSYDSSGHNCEIKLIEQHSLSVICIVTIHISLTLLVILRTSFD